MRNIVINDDRLLALLKEKDNYSKLALEKRQVMEALDKELGKILHKIDRLNTKSIDLAKPYQTEELGEFEYYTRIYEDKETGELRMEIADKIEDTMNFLREEKRKREEKEQKEKELQK